MYMYTISNLRTLIGQMGNIVFSLIIWFRDARNSNSNWTMIWHYFLNCQLNIDHHRDLSRHIHHQWWFITTILTLTSLRFLWSQMKPFFRGKILYTPDTPATRCQHHLINIVLITCYPMHCNAIKLSTGRRLVGAVDSSYFRPVETLQAALRHWEETYSEQVAGFVLNK